MPERTCTSEIERLELAVENAVTSSRWQVEQQLDRIGALELALRDRDEDIAIRDRTIADLRERLRVADAIAFQDVHIPAPYKPLGSGVRLVHAPGCPERTPGER